MPRTVCLWLAVACAATGCVRQLQVYVNEAAFEAGVPVTLTGPGPTLKWDFGDGSPQVRGVHGRHAWARAGHFVVQAWDGDFLAVKSDVTVVPRPLLRAVPTQATAVFYAPRLGQPLSEAVDFLERAVGSAQLQKWLDETAIPQLAVEASSGNGLGLDASEGVGVFTLEGVEGRVALVGADDEALAEAALVARLEERGAEVAERTEDGVVVATFDEGLPVVVFTNRGYLYAVWPGSPLDAARAVALIRSSVEGSAVRGASGAAGQLAFRLTPGAGASDWSAAEGSFQVQGHQAVLDGLVRGKKPLWQGQAQVPLTALAPAGPIFAAAFGLPPDVLASLALGARGSGRRGRLAESLRQEGVDLEASLAGFSGEAGALVYFDAESFLRNLVSGTQKPEPRGAVVAEAGVKDAAAVAPLLRRVVAWLAPGASEHAAGPERAWKGRWLDAAMQLRLSPRAARLSGGTGAAGRPAVELARSLAGRFGGAFGPGHVSVLVDVGQLRRELEAPRPIAGLDPARLVTVQGFATAFLDQLTPLDTVLVDLWPDPAGAQLRGRVTVKPR